MNNIEQAANIISETIDQTTIAHIAVAKAADNSLDAAVILMAEQIHAAGLAIKAESLNELRGIVAPVVESGVKAIIKAVGAERAAAAAAVIERDLPAQVVAMLFNVQAQARAKSLALSVAAKHEELHRRAEVKVVEQNADLAVMKTLAHPAAAALPVPQRSLSADEALAGIRQRESRKGSKR